jgi:hypothetical protein
LAESQNGNTYRAFVWKPLGRKLDDIKTDLREMGHEDGSEVDFVGIWTDDAFWFQRHRLVRLFVTRSLGWLVMWL